MWFRGVLHRLDLKAATGKLLQDDLEHAAVVIVAFKHTVQANWRRGERRGEIA